jgi:hypothetical protein
LVVLGSRGAFHLEPVPHMFRSVVLGQEKIKIVLCYAHKCEKKTASGASRMRSQSLIILHSRNYSDSLRLRWTRSRDVTSLVQSDTFVRTGFLFHEALNEWDRLSMVDIEYTTMNTNHARSPQNLFQRYKYLPNTAIVILPPTPNNLQQFKAHTQYPKSKYLPNTAKIIPPLQLENSSNLISKIQITPSNHEVHRHAHPRSLCPQLVRPSHRSHRKSRSPRGFAVLAKLCD